jgi:hypothetical protein
MASLLNENSKFVTIIDADGIASGTEYNGASAGATGIDTRDYEGLYIRIEAGTASSSGGVVATVIASESNSPVASDVETLESFGTLIQGGVKTGYIYAKGKKRYVWVKTVSTNAEATVSACAILYNADRQANTVTDTFAEVA